VIEVPWHKAPSTRRREVLVPEPGPPQDARPIRSENRAVLVGSIAGGRRWLDEVDEMMVSFVPAFTAVGFSQFDPTIFNSIDGSKMDAVSADHFHMLFDFARVGHRLTSGDGQN
jgi:hypothetical protein